MPLRLTGAETRHWIRLSGILLVVSLMTRMGSNAMAAVWNGSMRVDYQAIPSVGGNREDLLQQYYLRVSDRLFYKNQLTLTGNFIHRARQSGQPADFRPRYEVTLTSYAYGGQLVYEPHTQKQPGINGEEDVSRRWRGAIYAQPDRWPRFSADFLRARRTQTSQGTGRESWNTYQVTWQPGSHVLALSYSHQKRTSRGASAELVEVYRATASTDRTFGWHSRMNLTYGFDRTWNQTYASVSSSQDQHSAGVSLSGDPLPSLNWTAQYGGRFQHSSRTSASIIPANLTNHLASGTVSWTPVREVTASASRYVERGSALADQAAQRTDYWQGRISAEGKLYRHMRVLGTIYRLYYTGAPQGTKYNDAYFLAFRGQPFVRVDWSAEMTLADRHGRQADRFAGAANVYSRLQPLSSLQMQAGYSNVLSGGTFRAMAVSEENLNTNLQYTATTNMGISAAWAISHNRALKRKWTPTWTVTGTYRWPSFANIGFSYSRQQAIQSADPAAPKVTAQPSTLLANIVFWLGPSSTLNAQYTHQTTIGGQSNENWGVGISTSF
ncbi:MAG: hypothetical protein HZB43_05455 [candidate division Zixibacteria bacterium]|nr:hypothetical protein [candidate division Zixibacteria bacterium]